MENVKNYLNFENPRQLLIDVSLWFFCGGLILWIIRYLKFFAICCYRDYRFLIKTPDPIKIAAFFLLLISLFYFIKLLYKKFITVGFNKDKTFSKKNRDWPGSWEFNGGSRFEPEKLVINSARAGCLLKNYYWKNFSMSFDVEFEENSIQKQKLFGIIFRASNLDNYFMLEIGVRPEGNNPQGIKPHVRFKGGWEELAVKEIKKFKFNSENGPHKFELLVVGNIAKLSYRGEDIFRWELPTYVDVNHYESGVKEKKNEESRDVFLYQNHVQKIPFRLDYGLVGFRSHWNHAPAIIKNLIIQPEKSS